MNKCLGCARSDNKDWWLVHEHSADCNVLHDTCFYQNHDFEMSFRALGERREATADMWLIQCRFSVTRHTEATPSSSLFPVSDFKPVSAPLLTISTNYVSDRSHLPQQLSFVSVTEPRSQAPSVSRLRTTWCRPSRVSPHCHTVWGCGL